MLDTSYLGVLATVGCGMCIGWLVRGRFVKPKIFFAAGTQEVSCLPENGDLKLVIVVRTDLRMTKGKIAAQCCHAGVSAYKQLLNNNNELLREWELHGQPKVVVKVENEQQLLEIAQQARSLGLITSLISDAGRTQVPSGSKTVVGIGPGPVDLVNKVAGHLKLY